MAFGSSLLWLTLLSGCLAGQIFIDSDFGITVTIVTSGTTFATWYVDVDSTVAANDWWGIGINDSLTMAGADIYTVYKNNAPESAVLDQYASSNAAPVTDSTSDIQMVLHTAISDGTYRTAFNRAPVSSDNSQDKDLIVGNTYVMLFAYGPLDGSGNAAKHVGRAAISFLMHDCVHQSTHPDSPSCASATCTASGSVISCPAASDNNTDDSASSDSNASTDTNTNANDTNTDDSTSQDTTTNTDDNASQDTDTNTDDSTNNTDDSNESNTEESQDTNNTDDSDSGSSVLNLGWLVVLMSMFLFVPY